ncbi:MAG: thioredoxin-dependent thiol peroxidase [Pseudomonadota bacterium]
MKEIVVINLEIGATAPDFSLPADGGRTVSLAELKGKNVVLYLYPRDDTPGCTKEAIGFTDLLDDFTAANTVVLGMSKDKPAKHDKFIAKHDLKVGLLSDEDGAVIEAYGSWVEKSMYGKKSMGIERSTFLIDSDGTLKRIWRKVKVPGHVEEVLEAVRSL